MGCSFSQPRGALGAGLLALAAAVCAAGCSSDPPAHMTPRAQQSMPQAGVAPIGPTGGFPSGPVGGSPGTGGFPGTGGTPARPMDAGMQPGPGSDAAAGMDAAVDAGPELTRCADDDAGIDLGVDGGGAITCLAIGDLHVQYRAADTNATDQQIKPHFNLVNVGTETVPLSELKVRYWYTRDTQANQQFSCDYAMIDCGTVQGAFSATAREGADQYFELSFMSGQLGPGGQTGEIQVRLNNEGWAAYDESNDYSFEPSHTAFADYYRATLYRRGSLVWGAEPPDAP